METYLTVLIWIVGLFILYVILTLIITLILAKGPHRPFDDTPDWGEIEDHWVETHTGARIETWVVYPDGKKGDHDHPAVLLTHGWSRNRGRMVARARKWKNLGFTCILISVRNHGNSDKEKIGMSIVKFSHDIQDVLLWWGKPIIIDGHSIGAGASILVAGREYPFVKALVAEAPVRHIPGDLHHIYRPAFKSLTPLLMPGMKLILSIFFYPYRKQGYNPVKLAENINVPTLLIHGKDDDVLPSYLSEGLHKVIRNSTLRVLDNTHHSNIPDHRDYESIIADFCSSNNLL
ncbi:MAG: alpha/beta hydrolase [Candidatus Heimdallarchaeota archaeon]|nr:alpha/beta hydrolase [Candidatus Heimdallarchaeota archaeon]